MAEKKFNLKSWLTSGLRRMSFRFPNRGEALKRSRVDRGLYKCAMCEGTFRNKDIILDHKIPVIPYEGFPVHPLTQTPDWTIFIERLFCEVDNFQTLCLPCHDAKTMTEDTMRATLSKDRKEVERINKRLAKKTKKV